MVGNCCDFDGDLWTGDGLPRRRAPRNDSAAALLGRTESSAPYKAEQEPCETGRRGRRPLRSVIAHTVGRGALTPPHKGNGFPRQCAHWLGMTRAGRRGRRPLRKMRVAAAVSAGRCGRRPLRALPGCPLQAQVAGHAGHGAAADADGHGAVLFIQDAAYL